MAIDREAIISSVMFGEGVKSWAYSTPGDKKWSLPNVEHYDFDPAKSTRLLASEGFVDRNRDGTLEDQEGNAVSFNLKTTSGNSTYVGMGNFIRDDLAKVGIKVNLTPVEFNLLTSNMYNDFQYEAIIIGRALRRPDPSSGTIFWLSSGRHPWRPAQKEPDSPEQALVDQLMNEINGTTDAAKRLQLWTELHTVANRQAWAIWLPVPRLKAPIRDRFGNLRPSSVVGGAISLTWNAEEFFLRPGTAAN